MANSSRYGLPYHPTNEFIGVDMVAAYEDYEANGDSEEFQAALLAERKAINEDMAYQRSIHRHFTADMENAQSVIAACLLTGAIHGYEILVMLTQHEDGPLLIHTTTDFYNRNFEAKPVDTSIDLQTLIVRLSASDVPLGGKFIWIKSTNGELSGRPYTLYFYTKSCNGWLRCSGLDKDGVYAATPLARIIYLITGWSNENMLVSAPANVNYA